MAHGIMSTDNMLSVKARPWHGLGTVLDNAPSTSDAIRISGLDWNVSLENLYLQDTRGVSHKAVIRDTDKSILGVVGSKYTPLQNLEAFNWFNPVIESGLATIETCGSLFDGKKIFILAKTKQIADIVANDAVEQYILLSNSHDGTSSVRIGFTPIRVVCNNTLSASINSADSKLLSIRHTNSMVDTLTKVRDIMDIANSEFIANTEQYRELSRRDINSLEFNQYVKLVFPDLQDNKSSQSSEKIALLNELFEYGRGNTLTGVRGTAWAAYNAVTEYISHYSPVKGKDKLQARYSSLWLGNNANTNKQALALASRI